MSTPKYSVIVPLYNKERYIERTLSSILAQRSDVSTPDYELIVIDDGSTDSSLQVARTIIGDRRPWCRVVSQKNSGVAATRNNGVAMSTGEYICFLDSDDWWEPDFLAEMDRLIADFPEAGMYGTGFYLVKNGRRSVAPIGLDKDFERGYINYCQTYAKTLCMPITSSSVTIRRECFVEAGQFNTKLTFGEDFDLWIRLALAHPVALVNKPLSNYFQDQPVKGRATRRLHNPENHMLWNLEYLSDEEKRNGDLKLLLDKLRSSGLFFYYLSSQYHDATLPELAKIDWTKLPHSSYKKYNSPIWRERLVFRLRRTGATIKKTLLSIVHS